MIRHYLPSESFNIRGAIFEVHNELGSGFLESVYQEALAIDFRRRSLPFVAESQISINYKGIALQKGFIADFICYEKIIVELKAIKDLEDVHRAQLINYLRATDCKLGFLVNFHSHPKVHIERYISGVVDGWEPDT